jgi:hypothetical protein
MNKKLAWFEDKCKGSRPERKRAAGCMFIDQPGKADVSYIFHHRGHREHRVRDGLIRMPVRGHSGRTNKFALEGSVL